MSWITFWHHLSDALLALLLVLWFAAWLDKSIRVMATCTLLAILIYIVR